MIHANIFFTIDRNTIHDRLHISDQDNRIFLSHADLGRDIFPSAKKKERDENV